MSNDLYPEEYYERAEGSNYTNYGDDSRWAGIVEIIDTYHGKGLDIIEFGAAKGWFVHHARAAGNDVTGYDISKYATSNPAPRAVGYLYEHDATEPLPAHVSGKDIVCAWEFFEHIEDHLIDQTIQNFIKLLKPGGELWLKIGVSDAPFEEHTHDADSTHFTMQPRTWWRWRFDQAGLARQPEPEAALDAMFRDCDWFGRFFVYKKI
jgi:SAM-dependent methyltransferase